MNEIVCAVHSVPLHDGTEPPGHKSETLHGWVAEPWVVNPHGAVRETANTRFGCVKRNGKLETVPSSWPRGGGDALIRRRCHMGYGEKESNVASKPRQVLPVGSICKTRPHCTRQVCSAKDLRPSACDSNERSRHCFFCLPGHVASPRSPSARCRWACRATTYPRGWLDLPRDDRRPLGCGDPPQRD